MNHKVKGININYRKAGAIEHLGVTSINLDGMWLGIGGLNDKRMVRMVRWRFRGICQYILIGIRRGKVIPVARGFRKIRPITEKEKDSLLGDIELRKMLNI